MMKRYFTGRRRREEPDSRSGSYLPPRYVGGYSLLLALCFVTNVALAAETPPRRGIVSSVNPLATEAGLNVLKSGGNAIDAAVAVGLTLGVVDTHNSGIGGGCFMLIRLANGKFVAIDGREMAPAAATRDMFIRDGKGDTELSQTGALASGVPGEVAAFDYAVKKHGKKKLSELILPAAAIAENGFVVTSGYANRLRSVASDLAKFEASRAIFLKDGKPLVAGDVLKQPDLAATYRAIAEQGSDWFYRGPFAQATEKWMKANGGIMTAADLANYRIALREPVETTYRGYKVVSFPPPSSGGVHLVQMLNILEKFNLKSLDETTRLHVIGETMKLAFADRAYWLGDPDHAKVPRGLVSKKYAATLAKKINLQHVTEVPSHGTPPGAARDFFKQQASVSLQRNAGVSETRPILASLAPEWGEGLRVRGGSVLSGNELSEVSGSSVVTTPHPDPLPVEGRGDSNAPFGLAEADSQYALLALNQLIGESMALADRLSLQGKAGVFEERSILASLSPERGEGLRVRGGSVSTGNEFSESVASLVALTSHPDPLPVERRGDRHVPFGLAEADSQYSLLNEKHTTHWSVADAEGNWVACTATINTTYGSKVVIPGTGVVLNNEMDDFSVQPGVPNAFGLIGAEANAVAPGKRPLSSMTPTIVLKRGKPVIAVGAAGGPKIISAVLQELVGMLDLGLSPTEAMAAPRIHQQWSPDELMAEKSLSEEVKSGLAAKGHKVKELNSLSVSHMVNRTADGKSFTGAADPRAGGNTSGW